MTEARMVITIAREEGSGGDEIAQELARSLKLSYLDKEIIQLAARRLHISETELAQFDEKILPQMEALREVATQFHDIPLSRVLAPTRSTFGSVAEKPTPIKQDTPYSVLKGYHKLVEQLIKEVAGRGHVVIVGRGANFVLKDWTGVLNVYIRAPLESRIERLAYLQNLDYDTAVQLIEKNDFQRAGYIRQYYGADWSNSDLYQMVVNTAQIPLPAVTSALGHFAKELDHTRKVKDRLEIHRSYDRLMNQESYSFKEAADLLLISPETLRQAVQRGELKGIVANYNTGSVSREALVEWLSHAH